MLLLFALWNDSHLIGRKSRQFILLSIQLYSRIFSLCVKFHFFMSSITNVNTSSQSILNCWLVRLSQSKLESTPNLYKCIIELYSSKSLRKNILLRFGVKIVNCKIYVFWFWIKNEYIEEIRHHYHHVFLAYQGRVFWKLHIFFSNSPHILSSVCK